MDKRGESILLRLFEKLIYIELPPLAPPYTGGETAW